VSGYNNVILYKINFGELKNCNNPVYILIIYYLASSAREKSARKNVILSGEPGDPSL
jgi:hypothetical protein